MQDKALTFSFDLYENSLFDLHCLDQYNVMNVYELLSSRSRDSCMNGTLRSLMM